MESCNLYKKKPVSVKTTLTGVSHCPAGRLWILFQLAYQVPFFLGPIMSTVAIPRCQVRIPELPIWNIGIAPAPCLSIMFIFNRDFKINYVNICILIESYRWGDSNVKNNKSDSLFLVRSFLKRQTQRANGPLNIIQHNFILFPNPD